MKQVVATAIILHRTDYGEADRILTLLTPQQGKLRLLAKGVRRVKSKLAGGIELFSVSEITFIRGRGEIGTLVSTRLSKYYSHIVEDLDRTMQGYELIRQSHKVTEDEAEEEYFYVLQRAFEALNDAVPPTLVQYWFAAQLLRLGGHTPNLHTDTADKKLQAGQLYSFDFDRMAFTPASGRGQITADHIKFLRLAFSGHPAKVLSQVQGGEQLVHATAPLVQTMLQTHLPGIMRA